MNIDKTQKIYILVALGILDSVYLTITKYFASALFCPNTGAINCESVITSQYSTIFGVPLSILGLILFLVASYFLFKNDDYKFLWSVAGGAAVLYSLVSQAILGLVCIYCLLLDLLIILVIYVAYAKPKPAQPLRPTPAPPSNAPGATGTQ